jgi:hypothetical protein
MAKQKRNYKVRYNEYGHPYRVRLNVPLLVGVILTFITTVLWVLFMFFIPNSKNWLMLVGFVSLAGYLASILLYLNSKQ